MNKPTRWSYSSLSTYESCPAKWKFSYLDNLPYKASPAMARGTRLHAECEDYLNGKTPALSWELTKVARRVDALKNMGAKAENVWQLNQEWNPDGTPWVKAIVDVHWMEGDVLHVCDFKSGREYPDHRDQLELYGIIGLRIYPDVKRVEYSALYLDTGHTSNQGSIIRGDMEENKRKSWHDRAIRIFQDDTYAPNPGAACRWCDYASSKGGPCHEGK